MKLSGPMTGDRSRMKKLILAAVPFLFGLSRLLGLGSTRDLYRVLVTFQGGRDEHYSHRLALYKG